MESLTSLPVLGASILLPDSTNIVRIDPRFSIELLPATPPQNFYSPFTSFPQNPHTTFTFLPHNQTMRSTLNHLLLAAAMTILPAVSFAQPPGGPRGNPEEMLNRQMNMLKEQLELSGDQEKEVRTILADQGKKQRQLFENGPSEETREKMMKLQEETKDKMKKVLNADQFTKFEKIQAERMRRGPGGRPPGPPPQN
jgi:hypothetical protein